MHLKQTCVLGWAMLAVGVGTVAHADEPVKPYETVGVVLGGGNAFGWAHIGVLRFLEEEGIPLDSVVGTSGGGLVGGAYAAGLSPLEIKELLSHVHWDEVFTGQPAYGDLSYRRKEDRRDYQFRYEMGLRHQLQFPSGLDPVQPVGLLISRICLPASPIGPGNKLRSFSDLVSPFRAVSVDLKDGIEYYPHQGSLAQALRGTFAQPVVFTPEIADDQFDPQKKRVLVDGGLLDNVPVTVSKDEFHSKHMLAINLTEGGKGNIDIGASALGIVGRSLSVVGGVMYQEHLKAAPPEFLFKPDLHQFMGGQFDQVVALEQAGHDQAKAAYDTSGGPLYGLHKYSLKDLKKPELWQAYLDERAARRAQLNLDPVPDFVRVAGTHFDVRQFLTAHTLVEQTRAMGIPGELNQRAIEEIERRMRPFVGKHLVQNNVRQSLEQRLNDLTGEGRYESLSYELTREHDQPGLLIRAKEKTYGPPTLNFGADVNTSEVNAIRASFRSRLTLMDISSYGSEVRLDTSFGSFNAISGEYYRPVRHTGLFLAPRIYYQRGIRGAFQGDEQLAEIREEEYGAWLGLGYNLGHRSELQAGYRLARLNDISSIGRPGVRIGSGEAQSADVRWNYDGQDDSMVPTHGWRIEAGGAWFRRAPGATEEFPRAEARLSTFNGLDRQRRNILFLTLGGGTSFGRTVPFQEQFTLGGPFRLGALREGEISGSRYLMGSLGYLKRVAVLPSQIGGKIYGGVWLESGHVSNKGQSGRQFTDASAGVMAETAIGPVFAGGSVGEAGRAKIYLTVGRTF